MSKHLSVMRFLSAVLLLDIALLALVLVGGPQVDGFLASFLPGTFGASLGPGMTGDHLFCALVVHLDALLFLFGGVLVLVSASRNTLMIGSSGIWRLLRGTAGLSKEDIAATSFAVAEEQKVEIQIVHTGRSLIWIGGVLLLLAFPAVCFTWAHADAGGAPLLQDAGGAVTNAALSVEDVAVFAADQLADAVLLDIPRVFQLHLGSLAPGHDHMWLRPFVLLFHILNKLVVLATLFAAWRSGHLRAYLLQMAGLDAIPAAASLRDMPAPQAPMGAVPDDMLQQINAAMPAPLPANADTPSAVEHHLFEAQPEEHVPHEDVPAAEPAIADAPLAVDHPDPEPVAEVEPTPQPLTVEPAPEAAIPEAPIAVDYADPEPLAEAEPAPEPPTVEAAPEAPIAEAQAEPVDHADPMQQPIAVEPVHRGPEPAAEEHVPEEPAPEPETENAVAPAAAEELPLSDAPLALHELRAPETAESHATEAEDEVPQPLPYRNTALHLTSEFDA